MSSVGAFVQAALVMIMAGLGRGFTAPGVTKSVVDWFPTVGRATAIAVNQTAIPAAGILTAATLPPLALVIGWRGAAATVGGVILAGAVATAILYRDPKRSDQPARDRGVGSNLRDVLRNGRLWAVAGVGPLFAGVQFSLTTYLALYYNEVILVPMVPDERTRIVAAGGYLAVAHLGSAAARIGWGMVGDRLFPGRRMSLLSLAGILAALACVGMSVLPPDDTGALALSAAFLGGALMMGTQGLYMLVAAETAGARHAGSGVGLVMTGTQLGFVVAPTVFGLVLDTTGSYSPAWLLLAGLAACGALVTAILAGRRAR
jgi:sugar phosphate permease